MGRAGRGEAAVTPGLACAVMHAVRPKQVEKKAKKAYDDVGAL
jgi:hypothetical protein